MNDRRGSLWRKWDLHVHTPASLRNEYGGDSEGTWQRFLDDLEALPEEISVLGINDYLFLDGYRRILIEKAAGRLPKIDLILPVLEFRLSNFGGSGSKLSKVNYHIIFSNELTPNDIQSQFLNLLVREYQFDAKNWRAVPTRDSLTTLGELVIASAPSEKRADYGTPLCEGFNTFTLNLDDIRGILRSSYFTDKYFTAVGKTEWEDLRWNEQAIADKRNIITADFVFTAARTIEDCKKAKRSLEEQRVTSRLLDCSDAHYFSNSTEKDRIGHCYTWIKADTTFEGLRQVRHAPHERIHLGDEPRKRQIVRENPTKFIDGITIGPTATKTLDEIWFDNNQLAFNPDLVAIIGRKGMGKSALTDIIALTASAALQSNWYSFLNEQRFRDQKRKAAHFEATLTWEAGPPTTRRLNDAVPSSAAAQVRYIPQHYFERVCNETTIHEDGAFQQELRSVIFSHVPEQERGEHVTLDALVVARTAETSRHLGALRANLRELNREIIRIERELTATTQTSLAAEEAELQRALDALLSQPLDIVEEPTDNPAPPELREAQQEQRRLEVTLQQLFDEQRTLTTATRELEQARQALQHTIDEVNAARERINATLATYELRFDDLITFAADLAPLQASITAETERLLTAADRITATQNEQAAGARRIVELQNALAAPQREYQEYLASHHRWEAQRDALIGDAATPNTLRFLQTRRTVGRQVALGQLTTAHAQRRTKILELYDGINTITAFFRGLYRDVQAFLDEHEEIKTRLAVNFDARLTSTDFRERLDDLIHHGRAGAFRDTTHLKQLLNQYDVNDREQLVGLLDRITGDFFTSESGDTTDLDDVQRQLKRGDVEELYNYLFALEYLRPQYSLLVRDRDVTLLSPGERGILLLVFYLLVDRDVRPLLIDQPEENLDNESVYELLVPCIRDAKRRRQIFLVTHNPNLAVVCNAEQVIWTHIDKEHGNRVTYLAGGIEHPDINRKLVDVLEGTWPAFQDREQKYRPTPDDSDSE